MKAIIYGTMIVLTTACSKPVESPQSTSATAQSFSVTETGFKSISEQCQEILQPVDAICNPFLAKVEAVAPKCAAAYSELLNAVDCRPYLKPARKACSSHFNELKEESPECADAIKSAVGLVKESKKK